MKTTPEIDTFNALVAELDEATGYAFDRVTEVSALTRLADLWPGIRPDLGDDLRAAYLSTVIEEAFRPLFKNLLTT